MIRSENILISKISVCLFSTIWNCSATIGDPRYFKSYHFHFCSLLRPERNNKRHFGITWILHKLIQATDLFSMALRSSCSQIFFKISVCKIFDKFSQENNCVVVFLNKVTGLQVFTPLQLFLCEVFRIFNNIFFTKHLRWLLLRTDVHKCFSKDMRFHGVLGIINGATWFSSIWKTGVLGQIQNCWSFDNKATSSPQQFKQFSENMRWKRGWH